MDRLFFILNGWKTGLLLRITYNLRLVATSVLPWLQDIETTSNTSSHRKVTRFGVIVSSSDLPRRPLAHLPKENTSPSKRENKPKTSNPVKTFFYLLYDW